MTRYLVRVLDGESEGQSVDLPPEGSFTIGRKPGCDLILGGDDKISGRHAEIAIEGPMLILRDLGSTNGTRVDSRRIQELPVSHGDRFQIGATHLQLVDADAAPIPDESMSLEIDAAMLKRSSRRSPVALLLLVLIVAGGGFGYWYLNNSASAGGKLSKVRKVVPIAGNLISQAAAHLESDSADWLPLTEGAAFQRAGRGNSGKSSLGADLEITDETGPSGGFAVAMQATPLSLKPSQYRASAFFRTDGDVRVGLRLCFFRESAPPKDAGTEPEAEGAERVMFSRRPDLVVGPTLTKLSQSGFQKLEVVAAAPVGFKEVAVALVAVLPVGQTEAASVNVDDIALVEAGRNPEPITVAGRSVIVPDADASSLQVAVGTQLSLTSATGVASSESDPVLASLSTVLPLPLTDVLARRVHEVKEDIWYMNGAAGGELTLHVPADALAGGTFFARKKVGDSEGFEQSSGAGEVESVTGLLWGGALTRAFVRWPEPATIRVESEDKGLRFTLPYRGVLELELGFQEQSVRAKNLARAGRTARADKQLGEALKSFGEVVRNVPFDDQALRESQQARAELLQDAELSLQELRAAFDNAKAFGYQGLYAEVLARIAEVAKVYDGTEFEPQIAELRREVEKRFNERQVARKEAEKERLTQLMNALEADGHPGLAKLVKEYLNK